MRAELAKHPARGPEDRQSTERCILFTASRQCFSCPADPRTVPAEYAWNEGNYSMLDTLYGVRAQEKEAAVMQ